MAKKKEDNDGFVLENDVKVRRAIEGTISREGKLEGGVGADAAPEVIRAAYDKLGGLITKGGNKVRTGAFWDFERGEARKEPEIVYEHRTQSGELVTFKGEAEPIEVAAEKVTRARKAKADKAAKDED